MILSSFSFVGALVVAPFLVLQGGFVEVDVGITHRTSTGLDWHLLEPSEIPSIDTDSVRDWIQSGMATGDIDGDGDLDLIFTGALLPNSVYKREGAGYVDVTDSAGINIGDFDRAAALVDLDGDGDLDLFMAQCEGHGSSPNGRGASRMYRNDGTGVFEDITVLTGTYAGRRSIHGHWNDLDLDGLPDLYVSEFFFGDNPWYRNNGDGTFTDQAAERGILDPGNSHVASGVDSDKDGYPDLFTANDYLVGSAHGWPVSVNPGDHYFHGNPDGTWTDLSVEVNVDTQKGVMGMTFGDVNYDGWIDVYKSNLQQNPLVVNNQAQGLLTPWTDEQVAYGIENALIPYPHNPSSMGVTTGWVTSFMNADLDRWLDVWVVNGHVAGLQAQGISIIPKQQQNFMFRGKGPADNFHFADESAAFGLDDRLDDRGGVVADLDNDGDLDLIVMETAGDVRYFENRVERNGQGFLKVVAETHTSVTGGIGTEVHWTDSDGYPHLRIIGVEAPTASQFPNEVHFGLGLEPSVDVTVEFMTGMEVVYPGVLPNTTLVAVEPELFQLSTRKLRRSGATPVPEVVTIKAFAHSQDGTPLDGSAVVTIDASGLTPTGPVTHISGNEFERSFEANDVPDEYRVAVTFDGWAVLIQPKVHVLGDMDGDVSTVEYIPESIRSGSSDTVTVWVAPKDENGLSIGPGLAVAMSTQPALPTVGPVIDHGDGRYSREFSAPPQAGTVLPRIIVDGGQVNVTSVIEVAGPPDGPSSDYRMEAPLYPQGATREEIKIKLTPRDAAGRRLGPNVEVTAKLEEMQSSPIGPPGRPGVVVDPGLPTARTAPLQTSAGVVKPGSTVVLDPAFGTIGQRDGDHIFVLRKPKGVNTYFPKGTIEFSVDGVPFLVAPWDYFEGYED